MVWSSKYLNIAVRCWTDFYGRVSLRMYMYITIYNMHVINLQHQHPFEHGFLRRHQLVSQIIDKCIKETTIINVPMEKNTNSMYVMLQTYLRKDTHIDVYINWGFKMINYKLSWWSHISTVLKISRRINSVICKYLLYMSDAASKYHVFIAIVFRL